MHYYQKFKSYNLILFTTENRATSFAYQITLYDYQITNNLLRLPNMYLFMLITKYHSAYSIIKYRIAEML